tara:strand:- start:282 stop:1625 length:1344 start_codon:yes stop_codon:yes gene_type:complete
LFELYKILNPTWYYNLKPNIEDNLYWIDFRKIDQNDKNLIDYSNQYDDRKISLLDASYQLWQLGYISNNKNFILNHDYEIKVSLKDQYTFIRRFFKPVWVYYLFFIRLLRFNNPFSEIIAIFQTRNCKMFKKKISYFSYENFDTYKSNLVNKSPLISIIVPTLNRYEYLKDALKDLENQEYNNFEVIIVDQSDNYSLEFYKNFRLQLNVIRQKRKALWEARNHAIKISKGEYILLFDDDSRVDSKWVLNHLKCLDFFKADISAGVSKSTYGAPIPSHYRYFRWADQFDTGNALLHKKLFFQCGLFDTQFEKMRSGDGEFGARLFLNGFKNINNPKASRVHLKSKIGGLRYFGSWDGMRPTNLFSPRPIPSVLYLFRKYWGTEAAKNSLLISIPISLCPYRLKGKISGYLISFLILIIFFPIIVIQVFRSWSIASSMINEGEKIETID